MPAYPQAAGKQQGGTIVRTGVVSPRVIDTLMRHAGTSTSGTDTAGGPTLMHTAELFVPAPLWSTGAQVLNGTAVLGNTRFALYDAVGSLVATTAAAAQASTAAFQPLAWANEYISTPGVSTPLIGRLFLPAGTYYFGVTNDNTGSRFRTVVFGCAGGTAATVVAAATPPVTIPVPTTFTTNVGPYASLY